MERKQGFQEERVLQSTNISINGNDDGSLDMVKKEISCHSLYGLLVDSHLDCLKLCLGNDEDVITTPTALPNQYPNFYAAHQSELDQFMEAYCVTLKKLKEVIEEPQQESMTFINLMYSQLDDLLLDLPSSRG
ncbi:hypothetical protein ACS0TY_031088 [Phlomoides rotata]